MTSEPLHWHKATMSCHSYCVSCEPNSTLLKQDLHFFQHLRPSSSTLSSMISAVVWFSASHNAETWDVVRHVDLPCRVYEGKKNNDTCCPSSMRTRAYTLAYDLCITCERAFEQIVDTHPTQPPIPPHPHPHLHPHPHPHPHPHAHTCPARSHAPAPTYTSHTLTRTRARAQATFASVLRNVAENTKMAARAGPTGGPLGGGHWNDADMLQVGDIGLSIVEQWSHFSLWSIMVRSIDSKHCLVYTRSTASSEVQLAFLAPIFSLFPSLLRCFSHLRTGQVLCCAQSQVACSLASGTCRLASWTHSLASWTRGPFLCLTFKRLN
jgi:hypothetical protein